MAQDTREEESVTLGEEDSSFSEEDSDLGDSTDGEVSESDCESEEEDLKEEKMSTYHTPKKAKKAKGTVDTDLSGMMSDVLRVSSARRHKKGKREKGYLPCGAPFLLYHWEDRNTNNRLTLEVLLFGAIDQKKISLNLGIPDARTGEQPLYFLNPVPPAWLSMKEFENNNSMTDYNTIKQHGARRSLLNEFEKKFVSGETNELVSQQEFILPFEVENFNSQHPYEGTGYYLDKRPVVKKPKRRGGNPKIVDIMNVLVVDMVAEEKCTKTKKKKAKKAIYSKACTYEASSSDDESSLSSSDGDNNVNATHPINNQNRNQQRSTNSTAGISFDADMEISLGNNELSFETADPDL